MSSSLPQHHRTEDKNNSNSIFVEDSLNGIKCISRMRRPQKDCLAPLIIAWILIIHVYLGFQRQEGNLSNIRKTNLMAMNERDLSAKRVDVDDNINRTTRIISSRSSFLEEEKKNNNRTEEASNNNMTFPNHHNEEIARRK